MRYVEFTTDISTENVISMHFNAFSFFGGFTDTILYDNLKQVVIDRKIRASESRFNQKFMDFAEYYGIVIRLCYPPYMTRKEEIRKVSRDCYVSGLLCFL